MFYSHKTHHLFFNSAAENDSSVVAHDLFCFLTPLQAVAEQTHARTLSLS